MRRISITTIIAALFAATALASSAAIAKPIRTTTISTQSAEAFCHGHGGGTNCVFCHRDHCHVISCNGPYCTNTVSFRRITHGGGPANGGVKTTGGNAPPNNHIHPVRITGYKPPSGAKTTGGNNFAPVTITRSEEHHSGGHK